MTAEVRARIERELALLSWKTELSENPVAVIYRGLPSTHSAVDATDVLVLVPPGYPQAMLDYAFLPSDSPLRGVVVGAVEQAVTIQSGGSTWCRISYHPHNNGGGPSWNPTMHGFHTYVDELLTWLAKR